MGKLFTARVYDYAKLKEAHPKARFVCVMRFPPKFIPAEVKRMRSMSPSIKTLAEYKKANDFDGFTKAFEKEVLSNPDFKDDACNVCDMLVAQDVVLMCHEKYGENCHRHLLPKLILGNDMSAYGGELLPPVKQTELGWE